MRYLIWLGLFWLATTPLFAQEGGRLAFKQFADFQGTTTLMVLYDDAPAYNQALRAAVAAHWSLTPVQFIQEKEIAKYANDTRYSMLVRDHSEKSHSRVTGTTVIRRNHLALYVCGKGPDLKNYGGKAAVTQFEFADINDVASYAPKLPALIGAMHSYLTFLSEEKITEDNHDKKLEYFRNADAGKLSGMTLYLLNSDLPEALRDPNQLLKQYPYDFEIVNADLFGQAMRENRTDAAFLHLGPQAEDVYVLTAQGKPLYHAHPGLRENLEARDFAHIAHQVANPPEAPLSFMDRLRKLFGGKRQAEG
ncbi:MAG: hypothetical protein D6722_21035 [Bacteroidetes bacterium]|nr:MAG: hypothetical protein D6722_21035 [Bacteroidota bacterium]